MFVSRESTVSRQASGSVRLSGEDSDTLEHERGLNGHFQTCLEAATAEQPVARFVRIIRAIQVTPASSSLCTG